MPLPLPLATIVACGSLVTSIKSTWELSRMIREKLEERQTDEYAARLYRSLRTAVRYGILTETEYKHWLEKFLVAAAAKDQSALRKIRVRLRILYNDVLGEGKSRQRSRERSTRSLHQQADGKRRDTERTDLRRRATFTVPERSQKERESNWLKISESVKYVPPGKVKTEVIRLARLQRQSSVSYERAGPSRKSSELCTEYCGPAPVRERVKLRKAVDPGVDYGNGIKEQLVDCDGE